MNRCFIASVHSIKYNSRILATTEVAANL